MTMELVGLLCAFGGGEQEMSLFDAGEHLHPHPLPQLPVSASSVVLCWCLWLQSSPRGWGLNYQKYQVKRREKKLKSDIAQTHETLPQQDQWAGQGEE